MLGMWGKGTENRKKPYMELVPKFHQLHISKQFIAEHIIMIAIVPVQVQLRYDNPYPYNRRFSLMEAECPTVMRAQTFPFSCPSLLN